MKQNQRLSYCLLVGAVTIVMSGCGRPTSDTHTPPSPPPGQTESVPQPETKPKPPVTSSEPVTQKPKSKPVLDLKPFKVLVLDAGSSTTAIVYSRDGRRLAWSVGDSQHSTCLVQINDCSTDPTSPQLVKQIPLHGWVWSMAFSASGDRLYVVTQSEWQESRFEPQATLESCLRVLSVPELTEVAEPVRLRDYQIFCRVAVAPDGSAIAVSGRDAKENGWVEFRDPSTLAQRAKVVVATRTPQSPGIDPDCIAYTPDGGSVICAVAEKLHFIDSRSSAISSTLDIRLGAYCFAVSPDGQRLAVLGPGEHQFLIDAAKRKVLGKPELWHLGSKQQFPTRYIAFSPDGAYLATRGEILDAKTLKTLGKMRDDSLAFKQCIFSPKGSLLVTVGRDIRFWDLSPLTP